MTWWIRFYLGLPARRQDINELRQSLPELFGAPSNLDGKILLPWWPLPVVRELTVNHLRRWAHLDEVSTEPASGSPDNCPAENCPLRYGSPSSQTGDVTLAYLMRAGGAHKAPKQQFIDLVRQVHKDHVIKEVILTDPYIYLDLSEKGEPGGYNALVDYLRALRLTPESRFALKLNPSPKKTTERARKLLHRKVKGDFPRVQLGTFSTAHRFHDRFYLTRDHSDTMTGVFGPSLNSLRTKTIVLMGELEEGAIQQLGALL